MSTGSKWLIGCGAGCGIVILIAVLLGLGGYLIFRPTAEKFDQVAETGGTLDDVYGPVKTFIPWPDGRIPADRVVAFLAVRDSLAATRRQFEQDLTYFPEAEARLKAEGASVWQKIRTGLQMGRRGLDLGQVVGQHLVARNSALMAQGMGMGEYVWLYAIIYYSWLGHSPSDAPRRTELQFGDDDEIDQGEVDLRWDQDERGGPPPERMRHRQRRIWDLTLAMLENQQAALDSLPAGQADPDWRRAVDREVERMKGDPGTTPWQGDLPARMAASLEPMRAQLEAGYSRDTNPFALSEGEGRHGVQVRIKDSD